MGLLVASVGGCVRSGTGAIGRSVAGSSGPPPSVDRLDPQPAADLADRVPAGPLPGEPAVVRVAGPKAAIEAPAIEAPAAEAAAAEARVRVDHGARQHALATAHDPEQRR